MLTKLEPAGQKYRPEIVKYLLVAEAPPQEDSERFFYCEHVHTRDSLFLETMKVLYPNNTLGTKYVRRRKSKFLEQFKRDGFNLIYSVDKPISDRSKKHKEIRSSLPTLFKKLSTLGEADVKTILISAPVYEVCVEALTVNKFNVINREMIDFPESGKQIKLREKLGYLLQNHGYKSGEVIF